MVESMPEMEPAKTVEAIEGGEGMFEGPDMVVIGCYEEILGLCSVLTEVCESHAADEA